MTVHDADGVQIEVAPDDVAVAAPPANGQASDAQPAATDESSDTPSSTPPRGPVTPKIALLRYPVTAVVVFVVVLVVALGAALLRTPTYTAEARLIVGQTNVPSRAVPGFTAATQTLASIYARVVDTNAVAEPAATAVGGTTAAARAALSASPIPDSSIVRIEASSADERRATRLAAAAASALRDYVTKLDRADPYATQLYRDYQLAVAQLATAQVRESSITQQVNALIGRTGGGPAVDTPEAAVLVDLQTALVAAKTATFEAQLKADSLKTSFVQATQSRGETADITVIAPAASQGSNRRSTLQLAAILGIVAGIVCALGVVLLRANLGYLRELRRSAQAQG